MLLIMLEDLNLLKDFESLWAERNVSRAAQRLGIGQPAMSARLQKLRAAFSDPLFVRQYDGLTPSPRAMLLAPTVLAALSACRAALAPNDGFVAARAEGRLVIAGTDYFDVLAMPWLIPQIHREAPNVQIVTRTVRGPLPKRELENGSIDVAVAGFFRDVPEGFFRQKLFDDHYVCTVRKNHPVVRGKLTKATFLALSHLLISPDGDLDGAVDLALARHGKKRRVVAGVGNFHAPGPIVANSDLILTAPNQLVRSYAEHLPLEIYEPPFVIPGFTVIQVWHARTHEDPLRAWVRSLIQRVAARVWPR
jgi:DNA-binding transcriptional LysR family regulator